MIKFLMPTWLMFGLALASSGWASDCDDLLKKNEPARSKFEIIESPRVPGDAEKYREYVKELTEPGGVLDKLGITMTGQVVEFVQPRDLNALTSGSAGGYPVAHYIDGASVLRSLNPSGGFALEVVYPGPIYQHGFYRDDNQQDQQFSIIDHVVGHNHFAYTSGLTHYRVGQGLEATKKLDRDLRYLYEGLDKDEVQRWYLWTMTLTRLVDWYTPLHSKSEEFLPDPSKFKYDPLNRKNQNIRHPAAPTENVLPAFAANMSPHEPEWKRNLLEHLIVSKAFVPALVHTQIMNEGWASIMQEIIPPHTKTHHNLAYWLQASRVMQSENTPNLGDPYSLGVALWRRIREKHNAQPEIRSLSQVEKDRKFIEQASEIIRTMTDEEFIRLGMDQVFVDRFKLGVLRRTTDDERDPNLPPPQDPEQNAQWIIVSRDAERVAQMVINKVLKPKYYFNPRVTLVDFNRPGSGEIELVIDDPVGRDLPLKGETLAPALYAMSKVIDKPISLECTLLETKITEDRDHWIWNMPDEWRDRYLESLGLLEHSLIRVRIVVSPTAEVRVHRVMRERPDDGSFFIRNRILEEKLDEELTQYHSEQLAGYIGDLYLEDSKTTEQLFHSSQSLRKALNEGVAKVIDMQPYDGMVSQAGNASGAILEYQTMVQRRMAAALERAVNKKGGVVVTGRGARIKALPSVVNIEFDYDYIEKKKKDLPVQPLSKSFIGRLNKTFEKGEIPGATAGPFDPDEAGGGTVGGIGGEKGDRFWGPGENEGGGQPGTQAGEDPEDLSWVDLPDDLYARFLGEKVKLPILNKKSGDSRTRAMKSGGRISKPQGQYLPLEIMENALRRGIGASLSEHAEGGDLSGDPFENLEETFELGYDRLLPRDIVVKHRKPTKRPDIKAVVTFVLDGSASTAKYFEAFKRFVYDVEALVRANYRGFDFRYIVFDTQAHVLKTRQEFFKAKLGGGTDYSVGIERAKKLLHDEYPRSQWDRYTFVLGDMEDWSPEKASILIEDLLSESEFFGTVAGLYQDPAGLPLMSTIMNEAATNPAVGYTILDQDGGYRIKNIREVLKNEEE